LATAVLGEFITETDLVEVAEELGPLREDLLRGEHARAALAIHQQQQLEAAHQRIERAHVEGLGELEMVVHPEIFVRMMAVHGRDCWESQEFRNHMKKCNPGMAIRSRPRTLTVRLEVPLSQQSDEEKAVLEPTPTHTE
jgi:hypothetical protein